MIKKVIILFFGFLFLSSFSTIETYASNSASSLKREISSINYTIQQNERKIRSIKSSSRISEYDKKRKIRDLERENSRLKSKVSRIKYEYKRAIS